MKQRLKLIVEGVDTPAGKAFDYFIQLLIILSLVAFSYETLPDIKPSIRTALSVFETVSVIIFTVEYSLRIYVADSRLRYVFSFYGLIDLAAILPFYLATRLDLRSVRVFRLFRLVRILKIMRFSRAIARFQLAFRAIRSDLLMFLSATMFLIYVAGVGIYYFENEAQPDKFSSIFHSLWWAVSTLTTVGYGDVYPITLGGRIFTFFILLLGLGIVAVPTGLISSALTTISEKDVDAAVREAG